MRDYILEFLKGQEPGIIYQNKEYQGLFSYIWRVWLSKTEDVLSIFIVYTPTTVIFAKKNCSSNLVGDLDNSFYGKLNRMVKLHSSVEEAIRECIPSISEFTSCYLHNCDLFIKKTRAKKSNFNGYQLLHFDCICAGSGLFSLLFKRKDKVEHCILLLGVKNYLKFEVANKGEMLTFFDYLFGGVFDIAIYSEPT